MAIVDVNVPQLSESVAEATLLQWKKKPGDAVAMDEILIEVETDKVVLEVPAPAAGVITEVEPANQGPWFYVQHHFLENMGEGQKLGYAGRPASASPAVGYYAKHNEQQKALLDAAFGKLKGVLLHK